ncbi:LamG domain-containing protein [Peterkaempfera bronchialis]|uniref:LamG domain-containing protein n=1 Tax=Peterkaempfera bronchialis TaxID=2126346 RepID=A0A345T1U4_9ACTN|nr:LamG domain-containing protein [Peterkaempfera bronchialis]AXI79949.1 LamG domain-containing protein [Peterkaempfera bronchialis]
MTDVCMMGELAVEAAWVRHRAVRTVLAGLVVGGVLAGLPVPGGLPQAAAAEVAPVSDPSIAEDGSQADTPESVAVAEARRTGKAVDVPSLRTESSEVVAHPDGRLEATVHVQPVRTRKGGAWVGLDSTLRTLPSGAVAPKAVLSDLEFSGGGAQPLVRLSRAGKELRLTWPDPLPAPVVNGSTAEYRSVLPDVDLQLTATDSGFSQLLVVRTAEAARNPALARLTMGLAGDGLKVEQQGDGSLAAVDTAAGGTVFEAPKPMMYDSSEEAEQGPGTALVQTLARTLSAQSPADGTDQAHAASLGVEVSDSGRSLTLTPDQQLLRGPHTVFPVLIDPRWETPKAADWAGVSRANPSQPYWHFSYNSSYVADFGTGYCVSANCSPEDVKRVLYRIPTSAWAGKHILEAEFRVTESFSYSCTASPVHLWWTNNFDKNTDWNKSQASGFWRQDLQTLNVAHGWSSSCPASRLEFGGKTGAVRDLIQKGADSGATAITFGLRAGSESDANGWKRFRDDADLHVYYNLPPRQAPMSDLSMSPGSVCSSTTVGISKRPTVTARVSDPDGDTVGIQFAAGWDTGDGTGQHRRWWSTGAESTVPTTLKASGSQFSVLLPSAIPLNKKVGWEVRAWDGAEWGPWSAAGDKATNCYFLVDTTIPAGPKVASASYPGSQNPLDPLAWVDGVGRYGSFTVSTSSTDVVKYRWSLDTSPTVLHDVATTGGAARTINVMPDKQGPRHITVQAIDAVNNASEPMPYYFNVLNGHPQRAGWGMDETSGAVLTGTGGAFPATLGTGATPKPDGHRGAALALDGTSDGYAATDAAILDTSRSFTVSAWVNPAATVSNYRAAVSQNGSYMGAFHLGIREGVWAFTFASTDGAGYSYYGSKSSAPVTVGQWTHLTGVYNSSSKTITLYVNGTAAPATSVPAMWDGHGPFQIGSYWWRGTQADPWFGSVDEVRAWDRALSASEAANVAQDKELTSGRPAKAAWTFNEGSSTVATGTGEADSLTLYNNPATGQPGMVDKAVKFNGTNQYARTTRPQIDGTGSFSVAAWVKLPTPASGDTKAKVAVTQNGTQNYEFSLYYSAASKKWIFGRYKEDAAADTLVRAAESDGCAPHTTTSGMYCAGPTGNEWTYLVGVSDATAGKLRLYVNGNLTGESSYAQKTPWSAPGSVQIGAVSRAGALDEFFGGTIDDVRLFDRVLSTTDIRETFQQHPVLAGRWKFNSASGTPLSSPDESPGKHPAVLGNQASIGSDSPLPTAGSLQLDGIDDYAATTATPVDTGQSFTLVGWAQTAGTATRDMTVLSLAGTTGSAATVRWHYLKTLDGYDLGEWRVEVADQDKAGATRTTVAHTFDASMRIGWNHLALTYDAFSNQLSLYVNGQLENQVCDDEDTSGTCTDHVSWAVAEQPFKATGNLQFGRNRSGGAWTEYFSGQIDDLWAYQGVLTPAQVIALSDPNVEIPTPS